MSSHKIDYKKLSKKRGLKLLSHIQSVFLTNDPELWVNPFENRGLRYRVLLNKEQGLVYLYLTLQEISKIKTILSSQENLYFSGAFNQKTVYQIRTTGKINVAGDDIKEKIILLMERRLKGERIICDNLSKDSKPSRERQKESLDSLHSDGVLYCFKPDLYEYHIYERG